LRRKKTRRRARRTAMIVPMAIPAFAPVDIPLLEVFGRGDTEDVEEGLEEVVDSWIAEADVELAELVLVVELVGPGVLLLKEEIEDGDEDVATVADDEDAELAMLVELAALDVLEEQVKPEGRVTPTVLQIL
jgi:hypothetical protein